MVYKHKAISCIIICVLSLFISTLPVGFLDQKTFLKPTTALNGSTSVSFDGLETQNASKKWLEFENTTLNYPSWNLTNAINSVEQYNANSSAKQLVLQDINTDPMGYSYTYYYLQSGSTTSVFTPNEFGINFTLTQNSFIANITIKININSYSGINTLTMAHTSFDIRTDDNDEPNITNNIVSINGNNAVVKDTGLTIEQQIMSDPSILYVSISPNGKDIVIPINTALSAGKYWFVLNGSYTDGTGGYGRIHLRSYFRNTNSYTYNKTTTSPAFDIANNIRTDPTLANFNETTLYNIYSKINYHEIDLSPQETLFKTYLDSNMQGIDSQNKTVYSGLNIPNMCDINYTSNAIDDFDLDSEFAFQRSWTWNGDGEYEYDDLTNLIEWKCVLPITANISGMTTTIKTLTLQLNSGWTLVSANVSYIGLTFNTLETEYIEIHLTKENAISSLALSSASVMQNQTVGVTVYGVGGNARVQINQSYDTVQPMNTEFFITVTNWAIGSYVVNATYENGDVIGFQEISLEVVPITDAIASITVNSTQPRQNQTLEITVNGLSGNAQVCINHSNYNQSRPMNAPFLIELTEWEENYYSINATYNNIASQGFQEIVIFVNATAIEILPETWEITVIIITTQIAEDPYNSASLKINQTLYSLSKVNDTAYTFTGTFSGEKWYEIELVAMDGSVLDTATVFLSDDIAIVFESSFEEPNKTAVTSDTAKQQLNGFPIHIILSVIALGLLGCIQKRKKGLRS